MSAILSVDRIQLAPGVSCPAFPMRPVHGTRIGSRKLAEARIRAALDAGHVVQPKMNGDRASVVVLPDEVKVQNRHGGWYSFRVSNATRYKALPAFTMVDGEVLKGEFFPFDIVCLGGESLCRTPIEDRIKLVIDVCERTKSSWVFGTPEAGWVQTAMTNAAWEGALVKQGKSHYQLMGSAQQESSMWTKHRWV